MQNISATGVHADWLAVKSPELPNVSWGVPLLHCHGVGWRSGGDHLFSSTLIMISSFFLCSINNLYPKIELAPLYHWCAVLTKSLVETRFWCQELHSREHYNQQYQESTDSSNPPEMKLPHVSQDIFPYVLKDWDLDWVHLFMVSVLLWLEQFGQDEHCHCSFMVTKGPQFVSIRQRLHANSSLVILHMHQVPVPRTSNIYVLLS